MTSTRQIYTNDGGATKTYNVAGTDNQKNSLGTPKTVATTTAGPYISSSYGPYSPSSLGAPSTVKTTTVNPYTSSVSSANNSYTAPKASVSSSNSSANVVRDNTRTLNASGLKSGSQIVEDTSKGGTTPSQAYYDKTNKMIADYKASLNTNNGYSGGSDGGVSSVSYPAYYSSSSSSANYEQENNDILQKIMDLLSGQQKKAEEAYKAQLESEYEKNAQLHRSNANQINLNRLRAERYSKGQFGNDSGANYTNMARIANTWASGHNENNRNLATNNSESLQRYNTNLSNAYNTLASGYSNFVLPVYTNRQQYLDELKYRERANAQDYDYRKFLASSGIL